MKRLATILHISDLHIGQIDPMSGHAFAGQSPPSWWRYISWFDGLRGHGYKGLQYLNDFYWNTLAPEGPVVVVTGDVTRTGHQDEFDVAWTYLASRVTVLPGQYLGLDISDIRDRTIPGNHDHWPGKPVICGAPAALTTNLGATPFSFTLPLGNGKTVLFAFIDTDDGVGHHSLDRVLARGRFHDQIATLEANLTPREPDEIRVLVLHHSLMHRGSTLRMRTRSRRALETLIERHDFKVLLTGHVHVPKHRVSAAQHKGYTWQVLEARCGTTSQLDITPPSWPPGTGGSAQGGRFSVNTLLVHRLYEVNRNGQIVIEWHCKAYERGPRGFVEDQAFGCSPLIVWPT